MTGKDQVRLMPGGVPNSGNFPSTERKDGHGSKHRKSRMVSFLSSLLNKKLLLLPLVVDGSGRWPAGSEHWENEKSSLYVHRNDGEALSSCYSYFNENGNRSSDCNFPETLKCPEQRGLTSLSYCFGGTAFGRGEGRLCFCHQLGLSP